MKFSYFISSFLILFYSCEVKEYYQNKDLVKYISEEVFQEDEEVLNELFKNQREIVSRSSVDITLYKTQDNEFMEKVGKILWYQYWSFDTLKNEYVPTKNILSKIKSTSSKISIKQSLGTNEIEYNDNSYAEHWFHIPYLIIHEKNKGEVTQIFRHKNGNIETKGNGRGWSFTIPLAFYYQKHFDKDHISLEIKNMGEQTKKEEFPINTKKYYCEFDYSNQIISPHNEELQSFHKIN